MNITDDQKKKSIELSTNDISRIDGRSTVTTDQTLYEIASIKEEISQSILTAVKESAFDCRIHSSSSSSDEKIKCFTFGNKVSSSLFASAPSIENERKDEEVVINREAVEIKTQIVTIRDKQYAYDPVTNNLYDKDSIINKNPILVGTLEKSGATFKLNLI
jgi:Tfp pilus assembly protein FimT